MRIFAENLIAIGKLLATTYNNASLKVRNTASNPKHSDDFSCTNEL